MSLKKAVQSKGRQIQIQVGVCKRMLKEVEAYEKEVLANEARIQKMRDEDKDVYDIRKQEEVLQESYMMIPDSKGRLESAMSVLNQILRDFAKDEEDTIEEELIVQANSILVNYFGKDGHSDSMRWADEAIHVEKHSNLAARVDPVDGGTEEKDDDVTFPDEK